jgi:hypothetical protein
MDNFHQIVSETIRISIPEFIRLAFAGMAGGLIGAYVNDKLTRKRERDAGIANRKRIFLSFLNGWQAITGRSWPPNEDFGLELQKQAAFVSADFADSRFEDLVKNAFRLTSATTDSQEAYKETPKAIDALIKYVHDT